MYPVAPNSDPKSGPYIVPLQGTGRDIGGERILNNREKTIRGTNILYSVKNKYLLRTIFKWSKEGMENSTGRLQSAFLLSLSQYFG